MTTPIIGATKVVAARVETFHTRPALFSPEDPPTHIMLSQAYLAQLLHAGSVDNVNLLHRHVVHLLHPQRASRRDQEHIGVLVDLHVVLQTPVRGAGVALFDTLFFLLNKYLNFIELNTANFKTLV